MKGTEMNNSANIFSISRLRIETDGEGVRTLVCFSGCPLKCKLCPNKQELKNGSPFWYTPEAILESLKFDDVYYRASFGGITFGGGEPALQSGFIAQFRRICPKDWTVFIETSLNVNQNHITVLAQVIDHWYIDIKDVNDKIYQKYTGQSNKQVLSNLRYLVDQGLSSRITVRIPLIPGYNTSEDVLASADFIRSIGIDDVNIFTYDDSEDSETTLMGIPAEEDHVFRGRLGEWIKEKTLSFYSKITEDGRDNEM